MMNSIDDDLFDVDVGHSRPSVTLSSVSSSLFYGTPSVSK